jgi:hypothetical protein
MNEVEIPIKLGGITALKAELKALRNALAEATDPEQMAMLAAKAGEVADKIKDVNEQVSTFATGSKFEAVTNAFSNIQNDLMALDFEGASEKAETFSKTLGNLSKSDISGALKGLTKTISTVGSAFVKLGVQILTNPIFLLVAVITAIVVGIGVFLAKLGILQKAFDFMMIPVNALIDAFKWLTDTIGLTSYAAEDNARRVEKANEKAFASSQKRTEKISDQYDIEIARAKAAGKDTTDLEIAKSKAVTDAAKKRLQDAREEYALIKNLTDKDSIDRRKALVKRIQDENKLIKDGRKERQLMEIADQAEQRAAAQKAAEEAKARAVEAAKKYREGRAAIQTEINAANKLLIDSTKTQEQKEIDDIKAKYEKLMAEAKKYKLDITTLEKAQAYEINQIRKQAADENTMLVTKSAQEGLAVSIATRTQQLQIEGEANMKRFQDQKAYNEALIAAEQQLTDARIGAAKGLISGLTDLAGENKKLANALFVVDKALAIGEVVVNTQREIAGYWSNPTWKLLPDGGASLATAASAAAKLRAATSIGTIVASSVAKFMGGGAGAVGSTPTGGSVGGGGAAPSAPAVPSFVPGNLFGQGNAANNVGAPQSMESSQNITVTAVVSETEMTATQNKVNKIMKNSVL